MGQVIVPLLGFVSAGIGVLIVELCLKAIEEEQRNAESRG